MNEKQFDPDFAEFERRIFGEPGSRPKNKPRDGDPDPSLLANKEGGSKNRRLFLPELNRQITDLRGKIARNVSHGRSVDKLKLELNELLRIYGRKIRGLE